MAYYTINEAAAEAAKRANSYSEYKPGSATLTYRIMVDEATALAERQKSRIDPMYHDKINRLLDLYARKLAENLNKGYEISSRVPSILIAGGSNFPVRAKEKQNAAMDRNMEEFNKIQGILSKIKSTGMGGVRSDDPDVMSKLQKKLKGLEHEQNLMKAVNAYYRKNKTLDGCPDLTPEWIAKLNSDMASQWHLEDKPYPSWALSNNNANIHRVKERIAQLEKEQQRETPASIQGDGFTLVENSELCRIQFLFDDKPDEDTRALLKSYGFRWAPSQSAWQRMLNDNGRYAAKKVIEQLHTTGERDAD